MDKKAMMMIMVLLAVLSCLVSLGVSLWYYFSPSEDDEESAEEEKNDSLLDERPAFTLTVVNGDNETTDTVTPSGDETVDVTVEGDTTTTTGATTTDETTVLTCEEGQTESNGECVDVTPPVEPVVDPTILTCEEGQMESNGKCVDVVPEKKYTVETNRAVNGNNIMWDGTPGERNLLCTPDTPSGTEYIPCAGPRTYTQNKIEEQCLALGATCKGYHWHKTQKYGQLKGGLTPTRQAQRFDIYTKS